MLAMRNSFPASSGEENTGRGGDFSYFLGTLTVRRLRPLLRRALRTFRPPLLDILRRKPWVRSRLMLDGWYVRFMAVFYNLFILYCLSYMGISI